MRSSENAQVMTNGLISFTRKVEDYTPVNLTKLDSSFVMLAPYWADVSTLDNGTVYYREINLCDQPAASKFCILHIETLNVLFDNKFVPDVTKTANLM